jgi:uncharacterized protein (TIGR02588 family)
MSPSKSQQRNTKNALEWTVFGLSCALVAAAVTILFIHAIQQKSGPPDLHAEVGETVRNEVAIIVPIKVTNHGPVTASEVLIEVEAQFPSGKKSTELMFDFVPRVGGREGFVVFDSPDLPSSITPRVASYIEP